MAVSGDLSRFEATFSALAVAYSAELAFLHPETVEIQIN